MPANPFANLPAVSAVLELPTVRALEHQHGHDVVAHVIRAELDTLRERVKAGVSLDGELSLDMIAMRVGKRVQTESANRLRSVINATGIVWHTHLGRAPLAETAAQAAYQAARGYLNLELDLDSGKRSSRQDPI